MIGRLFWIIVGVAIGVAGMRKLAGAAKRYSPSGISASLSDSAGRLLDSVRAFTDDVRSSSAAREKELTEGAGLDGKLGARPEDFRTP